MNNTRVCKVCKEEKQYAFFCLNTKGHSVHKDEEGGIWHGKTCYNCFKAQIKAASHVAPKAKRKTPLGPSVCVSCGVAFMKKTGIQKWCSAACRELIKENVSV